MMVHAFWLRTTVVLVRGVAAKSVFEFNWLQLQLDGMFSAIPRPQPSLPGLAFTISGHQQTFRRESWQ